MKIYDDHFYCFSCQCGGDVIRLVSQLFSLTPLETAKKLQADFGIADVEFDKEHYKKEYNTRMKQLLKEKQFESWKHNTYLLLKVLIVLEMCNATFLHRQGHKRDARERCPTLYRM